MSKSLKLYGGTAIGVGLMLLAGYNFADRNITPQPRHPRMLTALPAPIPEPVAPVVAVAETPAAPVEPVAAEAAADAPADSGILVAAANADGESKGTRFGLGREALPEEIAAWDVNVMPDGTGLPDGSGNAADGEGIFEENCAVCHGSFAEGVDNWPKLAGGEGTLAAKDPLKTVGSYWPYLSTVFDYVHRSMPFGNAQTLTNDEVYAIVAYILYSNDIVADDFELSRDTWAEVQMPNAEGFITDDRAETEYPQWTGEPCMTNCKDHPVEITMLATVLDVTPDDGGVPQGASMEGGAAPAAEQPKAEAVTPAAAETPAAPTEEAKAEPAAETPAETPVVADAGAPDPALVAEGEKVFKKCKACHQVGEGATNKTGPLLNGVVGRDIGSVEGFKYSSGMAEMDGAWTHEALSAFLSKPKDFVAGTKMSFAGLKSEDDIKAVIAYLQTQQ